MANYAGWFKVEIVDNFFQKQQISPDDGSDNLSNYQIIRLWDILSRLWLLNLDNVNYICSRISEIRLLKFAFLVGKLHEALIYDIQPSKNEIEKRPKSFPLSLPSSRAASLQHFNSFFYSLIVIITKSRIQTYLAETNAY